VLSEKWTVCADTVVGVGFVCPPPFRISRNISRLADSCETTRYGYLIPRVLANFSSLVILEGLLTVLISFSFFFLIPNFPEEVTWLNEEERAFVKARLQIDQGKSAAERPITMKDVGHVFKDPKIIVGGFMYLGLVVPAYGYAYFSPAILQTYGYSRIQTQLHSVPPWAAAFVFSMLVAWLSDKVKHRFLFTIAPILVCIAGFAILIAVHDNQQVQYAALFLVAMGAYTAMPVVVCWFNMNLGGHHRRSVGSAWQIGFGNIGGIIAVFAFLKKDAPRYIPGYSISIAFVCLAALSCCVYFVMCSWQNRTRDRSLRDVSLTEHEKTELGDLNPEYRYQL
jgi:sugar phosphate permease